MNRVRLYEHVLRKDNDFTLRSVLDFEEVRKR